MSHSHYLTNGNEFLSSKTQVTKFLADTAVLIRGHDGWVALGDAKTKFNYVGVTRIRQCPWGHH